jgi:excisionase family DNA binding protein
VKGEIQGYLLVGHQGISDLQFDQIELNNYLEMFRTERGWLTRSEVAKRMGISLRHVSHLIKEGILPVDHTCGSTKYFFLDTLEKVTERISHSCG